jgi:hypothetical protein
MKDPAQALRDAYFQLLRGAINLNAQVVPVYTAVPLAAVKPYIFLSTQTVTEVRGNPNCAMVDCTLLIDIVTEYPANAVKTSEADTIGSQINDRAKYFTFRPGCVIGGGDFDIHTHRLESSYNLQEDNGANLINRRLLRFRDLVESLNAPATQG